MCQTYKFFVAVVLSIGADQQSSTEQLTAAKHDFLWILIVVRLKAEIIKNVYNKFECQQGRGVYLA
jgi:hypothetical protein